MLRSKFFRVYNMTSAFIVLCVVNCIVFLSLDYSNESTVGFSLIKSGFIWFGLLYLIYSCMAAEISLLSEETIFHDIFYSGLDFKFERRTLLMLASSFYGYCYALVVNIFSFTVVFIVYHVFYFTQVQGIMPVEVFLGTAILLYAPTMFHVVRLYLYSREIYRDR